MWLRILLVLAPCFAIVGRQDQTGASQDVTVRATHAERTLETLAALRKSRAAKDERLAALRVELESASTAEMQATLGERVNTLLAEIEEIDLDIESVASGIDVEEFDSAGGDAAFDLQSEILELIQPIIEELKSATESPRQIERLRTDVATYEQRASVARQAIEHTESLLAALAADAPPGIRSEIEQARASWTARLADIESRRSVAQFQLEKNLSERSSIFETAKETLGGFFRSRGLNVALALAALIAVALVMRAAYRPLAKRLPRESGYPPFYARLIDVVYSAVTAILSVGAALLVLYASGDWVVLGVALLFLLGLAWASKTAIPIFLEQIRLLLNFGTVRERERVLLDGIPYRVSRISFYTLLSNPDLAGGVRRLPIGDLIHMRSRTSSKDEIWFPCKRGDWVLLDGGTRGVVRHQSPDTVQLELPGGAKQTFPSASFLELHPRNISHGFRAQVRFGVDYSLQADSTTSVPATLRERVHAGLVKRFGEEAIVAVTVEIVEAGSSSLDYALIADVSGTLAAQHDIVHRAIVGLAIDTCNAEGWVIPFTQLTLHNAD